MSLAGCVSGLDAIRMLLTLGFRVRGANGPDVTMERDGVIACVPRDGNLSDEVFTVLIDAVRIDRGAADQLIARLRRRDTLPDLGEASPSADRP